VIPEYLFQDEPCDCDGEYDGELEVFGHAAGCER
jgi:hypothetical protein